MRTTLAVALLGLSLPISAQTPYLVKDINTTDASRSGHLGSSLPAEFVAFGNRIVFTANTAPDHTELWSTDGTSAGTKLVAGVIPVQSSVSPLSLRAVNGVMLFTARDANHGIELWASDGTAAGTGLLVDINPGPTSSFPAFSFVWNNRLLFSADDGVNGRELWISDGTAAGTRMLADLNPGSASSSPFSFTVFGNSVYFFAAGSLWKTDGTEAGTIKVASIPGRNLVVAGGRMFFEGLTAAAGWELWTSDGTSAGTRMVADIQPGPKDAFDVNYDPNNLTVLGDRLVFVANDGVHGRELWISDGTEGGTHLLHEIIAGPKGSWDNGLPYLAVLDGRAYFSAYDAEHGTELWVTDGTDAGTQLFIDIVPGPSSSFPIALAVAGDKLYFGAAGSLVDSTPRLWVSDGTAAGTHRLGEASRLGLPTNAVVQPVAIGGKLYFPGYTPLNGTEPWVTDGTEGGTRMIANIAPDPAPSSSPRQLTAAGNLLYFGASDGQSSSSLWRSDGTADGTFKLFDITADYPSFVGTDRYLLSYTGINGNSMVQTLTRSDGTVAGTQPATDLLHRFGPFTIGAFFPFGEKLFATVFDGVNFSGSSLWVTTSAPNAPATRLGAIDPSHFVDVAGRQMFYAMGPKGTYDVGLWITDSTPAGTYAVVPELFDTPRRVSDLVNAGGTVFFLAEPSDKPPALWKSDGTFDGTVMVKELPASGWLFEIRAAGRRVFFLWNDALWVSDGTAAGTMQVTKVNVFLGQSFTDNLRVAGDRAVFTQASDANSHELWGSDGTAAGTQLLMKLGNRNAYAASIDGLVYFAGYDDVHGQELWTTDGTPAGTKLLADINPGPASSTPGGFTKAGDLLYFGATTDATGSELWALPLTEPKLSIADARTAEGDGGTTTLRFDVTLAPAAKQSVTVDYATSDGTARAGEDYDAASGTLTFAPGETSKSVDIRVRGDVVPENNETFFVALRNASGARVVKGEGAGIIDDDDAAADLAIAPSFQSIGASVDDAIVVSNNGPRVATNVVVKISAAPDYGRTGCSTCAVSQVAVGQTQQTAFDYWPPGQQAYVSASVSARQRDPQTSNNVTAWTINENRLMVMDAAFLTPGQSATITANVFSAVSPASSDPTVVTAGAVTNVSSSAIKFPVTGLKPGTSTITLDANRKIVVTVVAAGTMPRWPGAVSMATNFSALLFDRPLVVTVTPSATAPFSGARATGTVIVTAGGQEAARRTLDGTNKTLTMTVYPRSIGTVPWTIAYSGDASFLPQTATGSVFVRQGNATLNAAMQAVPGAPGSFRLSVDAAGSPAVPPTGTLSVRNGTTEIAKIPLAAAGAVSTATATLANLPPSPTLTVVYSGDANYLAGSQQVRVVVPRSRAVHH